MVKRSRIDEEEKELMEYDMYAEPKRAKEKRPKATRGQKRVGCDLESSSVKRARNSGDAASPVRAQPKAHVGVYINLTEKQIKSLREGRRIQVSYEQLKSEATRPIRLPTKHAQQIENALRLKKGVRLQFKQEELAGPVGGDLKEVWQDIKSGAKSAYKFIRKNKKTLGPAIRLGLTKAIELGAPALTAALGQEELVPVVAKLAKKYAKKGVDFVGNETGAFGLQGKKERPRDSHGRFAPIIRAPDFSGPRGGSFLAA